MDGVLFDTEKMFQETWKEIADEVGVTLPANFVELICGSSGKHMQEIVSFSYQTEDPMKVIDTCMARMWEKEQTFMPVKKGVREILTFLKESGIPTVIASSSAIPSIEHNLKMTDLGDYFTAITSGRKVAHGKPAPDVFLLAAERAGVAPEFCAVVEDSMNGIRAGKAAGCFTVMVPDLLQPKEDILPLCDAVCTDLLEAKELFAKLI